MIYFDPETEFSTWELEDPTPPYFITNFDPDRLPVYEEAISTFTGAERGKLELKTVSHRGTSEYCSLWFFDLRGDLSEFWKHFNKVEARRAT